MSVACANPMTYGVDGLHGSFGGATHTGMGLDFLILSVITGIVVALGSWLFSKIEV